MQTLFFIFLTAVLILSTSAIIDIKKTLRELREELEDILRED